MPNDPTPARVLANNELLAGIAHIEFLRMGFNTREVDVLFELAKKLDLPLIGVLKHGLRVLQLIECGEAELVMPNDSPGCGGDE